MWEPLDDDLTPVVCLFGSRCNLLSNWRSYGAILEPFFDYPSTYILPSASALPAIASLPILLLLPTWFILSLSS